MNEKCSFQQSRLQNHVPFYCVKIIDAHKFKSYKSIRIGIDLNIFLKFFYGKLIILQHANL